MFKFCLIIVFFSMQYIFFLCRLVCCSLARRPLLDNRTCCNNCEEAFPIFVKENKVWALKYIQKYSSTYQLHNRSSITVNQVVFTGVIRSGKRCLLCRSLCIDGHSETPGYVFQCKAMVFYINPMYHTDNIGVVRTL